MHLQRPFQARRDLLAGKGDQPVPTEKVVDDLRMGPQLFAELGSVESFELDAFFKKPCGLCLDRVLHLAVCKACLDAIDEALCRLSPCALEEVVDSVFDVGRAHVLPILGLPTDMSTASHTGINVDTMLSLTGSPIRRAVHHVGIRAR